MGTLSPKEAQGQNFVATIAPGTSRVRLEIDELVSGDNAMTNLYLLALEALQKEDVKKSKKNTPKNEDWFTFYSLSGIHGQPAENWNDIQKPGGVPGSYCTHGELVFPTWHRVYIKMFEQAVSNKVIEIAAKYTTEPEKTLYDTAAKRFRVPFWDPFMPRNKVSKSNTSGPDEKLWGYPKILLATDIFVKRPGVAKLDKIPNPLYSFKFPNADLKKKDRTPIDWETLKNPPREWQQAPVPDKGSDYTIRSPGTNGEGNMASLELGLQRQMIAIGTNQWKLLAEYTKDGDVRQENELRTWASFSTHNVIDPRTDKPKIKVDPRTRRESTVYQRDTAVSLESWHDKLHGLIGTGQGYAGHMGDPSIAGFDPIFWLHHCNIDRLLAIYQALYPDKWLSTDAEKVPLYPFKKTATEFWNSKDVRDWSTLGYAVPGATNPIDKPSRIKLEQHLYQFYNWTTEGTSPPSAVTEKWPKDMSSSTALYGEQAKVGPAPVTRTEALVAGNLVTRSFMVQAQAPLEIKVSDTPTVVKIEDATTNAAVAPPEIPTAKNVRTWNAHVRVKKFAFNGSFNIHLFIGYIKDDQTERFITKKNEVGFSSIFATAENTPCANCVSQREAGMIYEDVIPISHSLYAYLKSNDAPETDGPLMTLRTLESFEPDHVVPFLKQNMAWRLTDTASTLLDDEVRLVDSKLEVTVTSRMFDLPTAEHPLGVYHPSVEYKGVTEDKVGGYGYVAPAAAA